MLYYKETYFNAVITEDTDARVRRTQIDTYSRSHCVRLCVVCAIGVEVCV
jgi:hypothetical protein